MKRAVILAPHPDDGEFSSGGTIKKLSMEGVEFWYVAFSPCIISVPNGFDDNILYEELNNAVGYLGIKKDHIQTYQIPVRNFPEHRQEILDILIRVKKEINPDLVLLPNSKDIHQDHQVIHKEGIRAFKNVCILGYELPWNSFKFSNDFYVKLEPQHLEAKWNAIKEYKSQEFRKYDSKVLFDGLARVRGCQINTDYAEAFELIRWVL